MQRTLRILFVVLFLSIPAAVLVLWFFLRGFHTDKPGVEFNKGENGLWLAHEWVDTEYSPESLDRLGEWLTQHQFKHLYLHTGPLETSGTIDPDRYPQAKTFLDHMEANFPDLTWYAWVGQWRSELPLEATETRAAILDTLDTLINDVGFEGIHYDIEPIRADDAGFLELLMETRAAFPETPVSVAIDEWQPEGLTQWAEEYFEVEIISYWSTHMIQAILPYVDQIVVMGYDTSISRPEWYRWFLEQQVIYVTKAVRGTDVQVLIGLPAYDAPAGSTTFHVEAENLENALLGLIQGLNNRRTNLENFAGAAIYAHWTMDDSEWDVYEELWQ